MSVYFDPRRPREEGQTISLPEAEDLIKQLEEKEKIEMGKKVVAALTRLFVSPVILMLVWNWLMPGLFGLATIGYLKAFGLVVMSSILFNRND